MEIVMLFRSLHNIFSDGDMAFPQPLHLSTHICTCVRTHRKAYTWKYVPHSLPSHKISRSISTAKGIFWNSMETFLACLCDMVGWGRQWHLLIFGKQDPDFAQPPAQLLKPPSFIMVQSRTQFHIRNTSIFAQFSDIQSCWEIQLLWTSREGYTSFH